MRKKRWSLIYFCVFTLCSCEQINRESQGYYQKQKEYSHGFSLTKKEETSPVDEKLSEKGRVLFKNYCIKCHGKDGKGGESFAGEGGTPANLVEAVKLNPNFHFFIKSSNSDKKMPGWKNKKFTDLELIQLTHYLKSLGRKG